MAIDRPGDSSSPDDGRDRHPDRAGRQPEHPDRGGRGDADNRRVPEEQRGRAELYGELLRAEADAGDSTRSERGIERQAPSADRDRPEAGGSPDTVEGGWEWKGLGLSPEANRAADDAISARRVAEGRSADGTYGEPGITPAMRGIEAHLDNGRLVPDTEKFALKGPDRFKEKLAKMIGLEPDRPPSELAAEIHDGIRYTFLFDTQHYSAGVVDARNQLSQDYEQMEFKPSWSGEEYKGINSQWRDRGSGQLFEVQFHTPESWEAKQKTHDSYEKIESPATPPAERAQLRAYQREISASVPIPPGALEFFPFKHKEG